jgi:hypothetical protein
MMMSILCGSEDKMRSRQVSCIFMDPSFTYPSKLDILMVKRADITKVDSQTLTGWTCMLPPQDVHTITVSVNRSFHIGHVIFAKCVLPLCLLSCYHGSLFLDKYS